MTRLRWSFIIGAGASRGTGNVAHQRPDVFPWYAYREEDVPDREAEWKREPRTESALRYRAAPTGANLYDELRTDYPLTWGHIPAQLADIFNTGGFEQGMHAAWQSRDERAQGLLIDMGLYFLGFTRLGADLYSRLVSRLKARDLISVTTFVSLNYECLFELAALSKGISIAHTVELALPGDLILLKPHGSSNFLIPRAMIWLNRARLKGLGNYYTGAIQRVTPTEAIRQYAAGQSMPPAMSLFAPNKPTPVALEIIEEIRAVWSRRAAETDVAVVIGARPLLADTHIWTPLLESNARVLHLGGQTGADFPAFRERLGDRYEQLGDTFAAGLPRLLARLG